MPWDKALHFLLDANSVATTVKDLLPKPPKQQLPTAKEIAKEVLRLQKQEHQYIQRRKEIDYAAHIRQIDQRSWKEILRAKEAGDPYWDR